MKTKTKKILPNFISFKNKWQFHPLPVVVIGTYDKKHQPNAMTAAWSTVYDYGQVFVSLSLKHKTSQNLIDKKCFTLAFATKKTIALADYFGMVSGKKVNKIAHAKVSWYQAQCVDAPIFKPFPLFLECKVISFKEGNLIGKIVNVVVDKKYLKPNKTFDLEKMELVTYNMQDHTYHLVGKKIAHAFSIGKTIKK